MFYIFRHDSIIVISIILLCRVEHEVDEQGYNIMNTYYTPVVLEVAMLLSPL